MINTDAIDTGQGKALVICKNRGLFFMHERTFEDFRLLENISLRNTTELIPLSPKTLQRQKLPNGDYRHLTNDEFRGGPDDLCYLTNDSGRFVRAYVGVDDVHPGEGGVAARNIYDDKFTLSPWASALINGNYAISDRLNMTKEQRHGWALGWGLAAYQFTKHKTTKPPRKNVFLRIPDDINATRLLRELTATAWIQDMINEPPNYMTCEGLTQEAVALGKKYGATVAVIQGENLKEDKKNFPLVYAVGRASEEEPRVVDMHWGDPANPRVTLLGKGVIFDTGGINIKDTDNLDNMKYDMAGAAHALGVAYMIMDARLPVSLRVLLPIVENATGPKGIRPGDLLHTRMGETIEAVNSDAEGRLILADTLYEACHPTLNGKGKKPNLVVDFATTGWHGHSEFPGFGTIASNKDFVAQEAQRSWAVCQEYGTIRPLLRKLEKELRGKEGEDAVIGDRRQCNNDHPRYDDLLVTTSLYLNVRNQPGEKGREPDWIHHDITPWRPSRTATTPYPEGLPPGGFAQGARSLFHMIEKRYGHGL